MVVGPQVQAAPVAALVCMVVREGMAAPVHQPLERYHLVEEVEEATVPMAVPVPEVR